MPTLTLKTHKDVFPNSYFKTQCHDIPSVTFGTTLESVIVGFNQNMGAKYQCDHLYNLWGQEIPRPIWSKIQIKENMIFYIDT